MTAVFIKVSTDTRNTKFFEKASLYSGKFGSLFTLADGNQVNSKQNEPINLLNKIDKVEVLLQRYNGAKDRIKLALGGKREHLVTLKIDMAKMKILAPIIKEEFNSLSRELVENVYPKNVVDKFEKLKATYLNDLKGFGQDMEYVEFKMDILKLKI